MNINVLKKERLFISIFFTILSVIGYVYPDLANAYLTYSLYSELKKPGCVGDTDGDCLDNLQENNLAWILAPQYFYDEDESCNRGDDRRRDFFQVRPFSPAEIQAWSPADQTSKWVKVTYFFLFPRDCQRYVGLAAGHKGDSEHVQYTLFSYNLRTWFLYRGRYWHHEDPPYHDFLDTYLQQRANEIGSPYPSVAADEDGHGSWPGERGNSDHCAGDEDNAFTDCFVKTMKEDYLANRYEWPIVFQNNIGGPSPEKWNSSVITVDGADAYTVLDVGHGTNVEYWTYKKGYQKFCGWLCSIRDSNGNCFDLSYSLYNSSPCASPLNEKVDTSFFWR